jgi:hypothetical protein
MKLNKLLKEIKVISQQGKEELLNFFLSEPSYFWILEDIILFINNDFSLDQYLEKYDDLIGDAGDEFKENIKRFYAFFKPNELNMKSFKIKSDILFSLQLPKSYNFFTILKGDEDENEIFILFSNFKIK